MKINDLRNYICLCLAAVILSFNSCSNNHYSANSDHIISNLMINKAMEMSICDFKESDSLILVLACGEGSEPFLRSDIFVYPYMEELYSKMDSLSIYPASKSLGLDIPLLFYKSNYYQNTAIIEGNKLVKYNEWLADMAIKNIKNQKDKFSQALIDHLSSRYEQAFRTLHPNYRYQSEYPDSMLVPPLLHVNASTLDSIRVYALCGDTIAIKGLEDILRKKGCIGEMAYYYYFLAYADNNPSLLYKSAQCMYEASKKHPFALTGAISILKAGKQLNCQKCIKALDRLSAVTDSIVNVNS